MTTPIAEIADALAGDLRTLAIGEPFDVVRLFRPDREPYELETLTLTVLPRSVERTAATRTQEQVDYLIDVGVQRRLREEDEEAQVAALTAIASSVADRMYGMRLGGFTCVETRIDPLVAETHLQNVRVFTSVAQGRFRSMTS